MLHEFSSEKLRSAMTERGINAAALSAQIGRDSSYIRKVLNGTTPGGDAVADIAKVLHKPMPYFFEKRRAYLPGNPTSAA